MTDFTLIVPYYRNVKMLAEQVSEWFLYPKQFRIVLVDDCSPEPAIDVVKSVIDPDLFQGRLEVYRVKTDIPWNRGGARNLGTHVARTDWIIHIDIDHLLPSGCAANLLNEEINSRFWYRFNRFRRGKADETRRKDKIPDDVEFGAIHPHVDSYLCTKALYNRAGGYDEDYSGCLGGGSPFLRSLERKGGAPRTLSANTFLCVYTRSVIDDASDFSLSRDTGEYSRRRKLKEKAGDTRPRNPLRFTWERLL